MGAERGWDVWVYAGQDGFIVQEECVIVWGECEIEDESAGIPCCDLVALAPFPHISDQHCFKREEETKSMIVDS